MKFSIKVFLFTTILILSSCAKDSGINQRFEQQYGFEIEKMRAERDLAKFSVGETQKNNVPPPQASNDWRDEFAAKTGVQNPNFSAKQDSAFYAYEDKNALDISRYGEMYLPNGDVYNMNNQASKTLPDDMFEVTYNTNLHPPFLKIGSDFDAIKIPATDAYQVKSEPSNKAYLLVSASSIQSSIDKINSQRTAQDIANSEVLIQDMKRLKREKTMIKLASDENNLKKKSTKIFDDKKNQVVVYNASLSDNKKSNNIFSGFGFNKSAKN